MKNTKILTALSALSILWGCAPKQELAPWTESYPPLSHYFELSPVPRGISPDIYWSDKACKAIERSGKKSFNECLRIFKSKLTYASRSWIAVHNDNHHLEYSKHLSWNKCNEDQTNFYSHSRSALYKYYCITDLVTTKKTYILYWRLLYVGPDGLNLDTEGVDVSTLEPLPESKDKWRALLGGVMR